MIIVSTGNNPVGTIVIQSFLHYLHHHQQMTLLMVYTTLLVWGGGGGGGSSRRYYLFTVAIFVWAIGYSQLAIGKFQSGECMPVLL